MAADEMHQLNNETIRGIGIGEKVSAPVCVINEQRCFTHIGPTQVNYLWRIVIFSFCVTTYVHR